MFPTLNALTSTDTNNLAYHLKVTGDHLLMTFQFKGIPRKILKLQLWESWEKLCDVILDMFQVSKRSPMAESPMQVCNEYPVSFFFGKF